jgi:hypothetical protein
MTDAGSRNAAESQPARELTSWKEIAAYLGVNVRTAQKWERERRLPVRRVSGPRSRVNTDTAAVDLWRGELTLSTRLVDRCYQWPLGPDLTAEVRFLGGAISAAQIDLLCEYLHVVKTALSGSASNP